MDQLSKMDQPSKTDQPSKMVELVCEYKDCNVKKTAESTDAAIRLMELHERGVHGGGTVQKEEKKKEEKEEEKVDRKRQEKRAQAKIDSKV